MTNFDHTNSLEPEFEINGHSLDRVERLIVDDPTTFEFNRLEMFVPPVESDSEEGLPFRPLCKSEGDEYIFDESCIATNNLVVSFRNKGSVTCTWLHDNYLFGRLRDGENVCYDVAYGTWYRCKQGEPFCYYDRQSRMTPGGDICMWFEMKDAMALDRDGAAVLQCLCIADVETAKLKQTLNKLTHGKFRLERKLLRLHGTQVWTMDDELLDVELLLHEVGMIHKLRP